MRGLFFQVLTITRPLKSFSTELIKHNQKVIYYKFSLSDSSIKYKDVPFCDLNKYQKGHHVKRYQNDLARLQKFNTISVSKPLI